MLRQLATFAVAAAVLTTVAAPFASTPAQRASLPSVSAPPPGERDRDVIAVLAFLASRHTGLADRELAPLAEAVVTEARRHGLDPELVLGVIRVESGGYNFAVSRVGAVGLMQLMPDTGRELAAQLDIEWQGTDTLIDPLSNIRMGTAYLRELRDRYDSVEVALAAYNWGPGRIDRRIRRGAAVPSGYTRQVLDAVAANETNAASS